MEKFEFINACADNGIPVSKGVVEDALRDCGLPITESKLQTNADRIRAMSDEELAEFLDECENKGYVDSSVALDNHGKMLPMLEWLKQPVKGE